MTTRVINSKSLLEKNKEIIENKILNHNIQLLDKLIKDAKKLENNKVSMVIENTHFKPRFFEDRLYKYYNVNEALTDYYKKQDYEVNIEPSPKGNNRFEIIIKW